MTYDRTEHRTGVARELVVPAARRVVGALRIGSTGLVVVDAGHVTVDEVHWASHPEHPAVRRVCSLVGRAVGHDGTEHGTVTVHVEVHHGTDVALLATAPGRAHRLVAGVLAELADELEGWAEVVAEVRAAQR